MAEQEAQGRDGGLGEAHGAQAGGARGRGEPRPERSEAPGGRTPSAAAPGSTPDDAADHAPDDASDLDGESDDGTDGGDAGAPEQATSP